MVTGKGKIDQEELIIIFIILIIYCISVAQPFKQLLTMKYVMFWSKVIRGEQSSERQIKK